jgi:hypothetical protein
VEEGIMEELLQRKKHKIRYICLEFFLKEIKGSPILRLIKPAIPVIQEKLTWIPKSRKYVNIWLDRIYGKEKCLPMSIFPHFRPG